MEKIKRNFDFKKSNICIRENEDGTKSRIITGTIPFNSDSVVMDSYDGDFIEQITPTAFNKTLKDKAEVKAFVNHDDGKIVGSTTAGTLRLSTSENGLEFEIDMPNTTFGNDAYETIKRGDCKTLSFGFIPVKVRSEKDEKGLLHNYLVEVKLLEISICVAFPAYPSGNTDARNGGKMKSRLDEILEKPTEEITDEDKEFLKKTSSKIDEVLKTDEDDQQTEKDTDGEAEKEQSQESTEETELIDEEAEKEEKESEDEDKDERKRFIFSYKAKQNL